MKNTHKILSTLFIIGIFISWPYVLQPLVAEGDAYLRANLIFAITRISDLQFQLNWSIWPPGHTLLLYFFSATKPTLDGLRRITLLFSCLTVVPVYLITTQIFSFQSQKERKFISVLSTVAYIFLPARLIYSVIPLTEVPFTFFFLTGLYFLHKQKPKVFFASFFIALSTTMRLDNWILLPYITFILLNNNYLTKTKKILANVLVWVFPIFWELGTYINRGVIHFTDLQNHATEWGVMKEAGSISESVGISFQRLYETAGPFLLILFVIGLWQIYDQKNLKKMKAGMFYASYIVITIIALIYYVFSGSKEWIPHRYFYFQVVLMCVYSGYPLARIFFSFTALLNERGFNNMVFVGLFRKILLMLICFSLGGISFSSVLYTYQHLHFSQNPIRDIRSDLIVSDVYPIVKILKSTTLPIKYIADKKSNTYLYSVFESLVYPKTFSGIEEFNKEKISQSKNTIIVLDLDGIDDGDISDLNINNKIIYHSNAYLLIVSQ